MLLFVSMTMADTQYFYLEQDERIENQEVEPEELKETEERHDWVKLLFSGGDSDGLASHVFDQFQRAIDGYTREVVSRKHNLVLSRVPLFIMHCSLKIHLSSSHY